MILYVILLIISTSLCVVAFLLFLAGDMDKFKEVYGRRPPYITQLPIITSRGQIVGSVEDLDVQLEYLRSQLDEKQCELESSKNKVNIAADNLKKLSQTSLEVKRYYVKLKAEIQKSEEDCRDLQNHIEDYKKRQVKLREEVNENVKYYTRLLKNIDIGTSMIQNQDIEKDILKRMQISDNDKLTHL